MTREERNKKNDIEGKKYSCNIFLPLQDEIECSLCNKFGHKETKCRRNTGPSYQHE